MPRSYSRDLREKVLERVDAGCNKSQIAKQFGISRKTLYAWLRLREESGDVAVIPHKGRGREKITDLGLFKAYVDSVPDKTLVQMAEDWDCCDMTIHRALKLIGYTHKKRPSITRNGTKSTEPCF